MYSRRFYSSQRAKNSPIIQTVTPKKAPTVIEKIQSVDTRPRWACDILEYPLHSPEDSVVEPREFAPVSAPSVEKAAESVEEKTPRAAETFAAESVKNMTFEDMMLTWLAYLGSSGECDDEVFIILGLILMIGA